MSDTAANQIESSTHGRALVLPRRNLESYLLNPPAIARVMSNELSREIEEADVEAAIDAVGLDPRFGASKIWGGVIDDRLWLERVDGARLLAHVFAEVSENTLEFRKVRHGPLIMGDIKETEPTALEELRDFVTKVVSAARMDFGT